MESSLRRQEGLSIMDHTWNRVPDEFGPMQVRDTPLYWDWTREGEPFSNDLE